MRIIINNDLKKDTIVTVYITCKKEVRVETNWDNTIETEEIYSDENIDEIRIVIEGVEK